MLVRVAHLAHHFILIRICAGGGQTPLMHAVLTGKENSVRKLLAENADVTIGEKDGYTPMHGGKL